jgi:hypothetical protein
VLIDIHLPIIEAAFISWPQMHSTKPLWSRT